MKQHFSIPLSSHVSKKWKFLDDRRKRKKKKELSDMDIVKEKKNLKLSKKKEIEEILMRSEEEEESILKLRFTKKENDKKEIQEMSEEIDQMCNTENKKIKKLKEKQDNLRKLLKNKYRIRNMANRNYKSYEKSADTLSSNSLIQKSPRGNLIKTGEERSGQRRDWDEEEQGIAKTVPSYTSLHPLKKIKQISDFPKQLIVPGYIEDKNYSKYRDLIGKGIQKTNSFNTSGDSPPKNSLFATSVGKKTQRILNETFSAKKFKEFCKSNNYEVPSFLN